MSDQRRWLKECRTQGMKFMEKAGVEILEADDEGTFSLTHQELLTILKQDQKGNLKTMEGRENIIMLMKMTLQNYE